MSLSNMRVSAKLYLGFSIPAVFMIIGTIIALYNMAKIQGNMERVVTVNNVRADLCSDMDAKVKDNTTGMLSILLNRDDNFRQSERKKIEAARDKYREDFKKVEEMTSKDDTKGHEIIAKVKDEQNVAMELDNKVLDLSFAHKDDEAVQLMYVRAMPAAATWMNSVDELQTHQQERSKARYEESEKAYAGIRQLMLFAASAAILLLGFIAFIIIRGITGPLNKVIAGLSDGAEQVSAAAVQVSSASQQLAEGTSEQASSLEETSSSLEEMSSMTKQNADNANQAKAMMAEVRKIVEKVNGHMGNMAKAIDEITSSSQETGKIIKTIDEIAFQTNLLALNAAVEAARAGEAGAGFAVVADEVRNLALRAAEAAKNTSNLIENTIKAVRSGNELTQLTQEAFKENADISGKVEQLVDEIAAASQEQAQGIGQVNTAVAEMDKVTQNTAANAEESAAASEELNAQAEQMKGYVVELGKVVGGSNGNSQASNIMQCSEGYGPEVKSLQRSGHTVAGLPYKQGAGKVIRPEQVIPLGEGDFKDF